MENIILVLGLAVLKTLKKRFEQSDQEFMRVIAELLGEIILLIEGLVGKPSMTAEDIAEFTALVRAVREEVAATREQLGAAEEE